MIDYDTDLLYDAPLSYDGPSVLPLDPPESLSGVRLIQLAEIDLPSGIYRMSTEPYCTRPTDTPPNQLYDGRMQAVTIEDAMWHPVWSRTGQPGTTLSTIELVNIDGALDAWNDEQAKGRTVRLLVVPRNAPYSQAVLISTVLIEQITPNFKRLIIRLQSLTDQLDSDAAIISKRYPEGWWDAAWRGKERPIALGAVPWAPLRLVLSNWDGMDVTDGPFEGLGTVYRRGLGVSRSYRETPNDGWWPSQGSTDYPGASHDFPYGAAVNWTEGKIAASVLGNVRFIGAELVSHSTFPTGTGGVPDGWTDYADTGSSVSWIAAQRVRIVADPDGSAWIEQTISTTAGQRYCLTVDTTGAVGAITVWVGGSPVGASPNVPPIGPTVRYGRQRFFFVASGTSAAVRVGVTGIHAGVDHELALVSVLACARIDTIGEAMRFCADRLGQDTSAYDLGAASTLEATNYRVAYYGDGRVTAGELLRQVGASYGAGIVRTANGQISLARLGAPGVPTRSISAASIRDIEISTDLAPGLSRRMLYARNYAAHSEGDLVDSVPAALASELMAAGRIVQSSVTLHSQYMDAALVAEPIPSLLVEQAHAQAEIDRICALYGSTRKWYSVEARLTAAEAAAILPGQTLRVYWPRYGLQSGRDLLLVLRRLSLIDGRVYWVFWG